MNKQEPRNQLRREHYFKRVTFLSKEQKRYREIAYGNGQYELWRCDKCDSEVIYPKGRTEFQVNQAMMTKLPCLPKEFMRA